MARVTLRIAAAASAAVIAPAGALAADDAAPHANVVEFVNETPYAVMYIYAHMEGVTDLEEDLLGEEILDPGERIKVEMDLGPNRCVYEIWLDLKTEQRLRYPRFDACKETTLHITMNALDPRTSHANRI